MLLFYISKLDKNFYLNYKSFIFVVYLYISLATILIAKLIFLNSFGNNRLVNLELTLILNTNSNNLR